MAAFIPLILFLAADVIFPLPNPYGGKSFARVVLDSSGRPMRYFPDKRGEWRYHVKIKDVSPKYLEALIGYEDRYFYYHPGVNPASILRSAFQCLKNRRIVSGGSTITMQVARIISPHARNIPGKIKQIFRAFQLELSYSKDDILEIYLNFAPFGGNIQGVQSASYNYFDRSIAEVNYSEAALLAVLPQAPSRLRPDRNPEAAAEAKNKVARRMLDYGYWSKDTVKDIMLEGVFLYTDRKPMAAPLLGERLIEEYPDKQAIKTYIERDVQDFIEDALYRGTYPMPSGTSAAAIVVENDTGKVIAYAGSAEYANPERFGYIDMIRAVRSPGSALKPFIYAMALDKGLIHSHSLLIDAPRIFSTYRAANFYQNFSGAVTAESALQRSLNVPAVQLLEHLSPEYFYSSLLHAGAYVPMLGNKANLSLALGGGGMRPEDMALLYTAFGNGGFVRRLKFSEFDEDIEPRRIFSEEASYIVYEMLRRQHRSDHIFNRDYSGRDNRLGWKTGTSYGFRDAWAAGITKSYTVVIWVGRPDNFPSPGQYGAITASPLLFFISDYLERRLSAAGDIIRPERVEDKEICWPSGFAEDISPGRCDLRYKALTIGGATPATLPETPGDTNQSYAISWLENEAGKRVNMECAGGKTFLKEAFLWPRLTEPWIPERFRRNAIIPPWDKDCVKENILSSGDIIITGVTSGSTLKAADKDELPEINISCAGARGEIDWYLNGFHIARTFANETARYKLPSTGKYQLTAIDGDSHIAMVEFYAD